MADTTAQIALTDHQAWQVAAASKLASLYLTDLREHLGLPEDADFAEALGQGFGEAQAIITGLLAVIDQLTGGEK